MAHLQITPHLFLKDQTYAFLSDLTQGSEPPCVSCFQLAQPERLYQRRIEIVAEC